MPKMQLTEREAEIIRKHREETRFYRAGAHAALNKAYELFRADEEKFTYELILSRLLEMKDEF